MKKFWKDLGDLTFRSMIFFCQHWMGSLILTSLLTGLTFVGFAAWCHLDNEKKKN